MCDITSVALASSRDVHVDVAGPVQRIEQHNVLRLAAELLDDVGFVVLLGDHQAHVAAVTEALDDGLIGDLVELLNQLALDVGIAGRAENAEQTGPPHAILDDPGGQGDAREKPTELSGGGGVGLLPLDDVLLNGDERLQSRCIHDVSSSLSGYWTYSSGGSSIPATGDAWALRTVWGGPNPE
jgi:hypothetical protein